MLETKYKNQTFAMALTLFWLLSFTYCYAANYKIEAINGTDVILGEGPHWKYPNLYYADLATGQVARYDSRTKKTYKCQICTAFCGQHDHGLYRNLYRFSDGKMERILTNVNFSNGMAWNYKRKEYYYIDSGRNDIINFDYDLKTGRAVKPKVAFHLDINGFPPNESGWTMMDGMTIDAEGYLYVVVFGSKQILKICTRRWKIVERIETPCKFISSATFGGAEYNELYVTSLNLGQSSPLCGAIFRIRGFKVGGLPGQSINDK